MGSVPFWEGEERPFERVYLSRARRGEGERLVSGKRDERGRRRNGRQEERTAARKEGMYEE